MKTSLDFEQKTTKELLSKLDFEFFLKQNIEVEKYSKDDVDLIYANYYLAKKSIKTKASENKEQFNYYAEGQVRKMFTGGFLPALFELDESRQHVIFRFELIGESWAYFNHWQTYYKRKVTWAKVWDVIIKTGSVLAFALSISKIVELVIQYSK